MGAAPLLSLPFLVCICESPLFLAVRGDIGGAIKVLETMAHMNGRQMPAHVSLPERRHEDSRSMTEQFLDRMGAVSTLLATHAKLLVLLSVIDGARSFMTGGSSYLFPDLFHKVGDCGRWMNLLASVAPLIGLATCYFCND